MSSRVNSSWARSTPAPVSTVHTFVGQLGVVVAVDRDKGEITLVHRGGLRSLLTAHPSLLGGVRIGGPVQVVTDGTVIQSLRCL